MHLEESEPATQPTTSPQPQGTFLEVLGVFTRLGITSFGGPIAHLGYFRQEIVVRRKWIDEKNYADLLALCQFLPGALVLLAGVLPASHWKILTGLVTILLRELLELLSLGVD